ncbi:hypothetical protein [Cerasicoccus fimbriatus]|uniref:hypothetical protein n=1 Tax=Cerasicoccus fimbriatus TaxID=3014554 RepID=UPI0022B35A54|nr:hypothetical protein [Cerasicoccus sp. TK19100]
MSGTDQRRNVGLALARCRLCLTAYQQDAASREREPYIPPLSKLRESDLRGEWWQQRSVALREVNGT